jgi:branched-chain amino acid transport system permease protein
MKALRARLQEWASPMALLLFVAGFVILYAFPLISPMDPYTQQIVTQTFMFVSIALAWNWLGGYVGQISFGHSAMFGIGGFVTAKLLLSSGLPFFVAWLIGGVAAGIYALLWGHPTLRLRGPYFAIATIGVGEATRLIATFWSDFTGGSSGTSLPLEGNVTKYQLYYYTLYVAAGVVVLSYVLRKSRVGLGLFAIKEDVEAAADLGVSASYYQDLVLFLSGAVVGIVGGQYASFFAFIEPGDMFGFERAISFVLMGVIGGIGTIIGPALGAVVFVILQETLIATYRDLYLGLFGLLLIVVILFEPLGLSGLLIRAARRFGFPRGSGGLSAARGGNPSVKAAGAEEKS